MTFTVTRPDDPAAAHTGMSLRDAITAANTDGNPADVDVINFDPGLAGKTITLDPAQGELQIQESVTIQGLGASNLTIDGGAVGGGGGTRIFDLFGGVTNPDQVTITGLTLQNSNYASSDPELDGGGAIGTTAFGSTFTGPSQADSLTVQGCVLKNNTTDGVGGAIAVSGGNLTIQDSTITNNVSGNEGGGIAFDDGGNTVHLQMDRDTVANNKVQLEQGGGLSIQGGTATINACTFSGNFSGGEGGAIANRPTEMELPVPTNSANTVIQNSTIFGNSATSGGGITNTKSTLTLLNDTIDNNTSQSGTGAGVGTGGGTVNILNTIVAGNFDGTVQHDLFNSSGTINAQFSLIQSPNGAVNGTSSNNLFGVSPNLGPLQNNGGPTMTQALLSGSPAIDAGQDGVVATDQRGVPRSQGAHTDIGAYELILGPQNLGGVSTISGNEFTPLTSLPVATFTIPLGAVSPSAISATINWGDNTGTTTGTVTQSGSSYTVLGSHTYAERGNFTITTTVSVNGASASAGASAVMGEELLPGQGTPGTLTDRLIAEYYRDLLGKSVDALGLQVWGSALNGITQSLAFQYMADGLNFSLSYGLAFYQACQEVAQAIAFAGGFQAPGGDALAVLQANYEALLDRPLGAGEGAAYLGMLQSGVSDQVVVSMIAASSEYINKVA